MLEYYVYKQNINGSEFERYNVFQHGSFSESLIKNAEKHHTDRFVFDESLKADLMYYFWSKCEYEIMIKSIFDSDFHTKPKKIDIYDQVMLNWNMFENYVWEHISEIRKGKID